MTSQPTETAPKLIEDMESILEDAMQRLEDDPENLLTERIRQLGPLVQKAMNLGRDQLDAHGERILEFSRKYNNLRLALAQRRQEAREQIARLGQGRKTLKAYGNGD
jgi:hypothetical protein